MEETQKKQVGVVTHFFSKISVAVLKLSSELNAGDTILIKGHEKSLEQPVDSMQIEHQNVKKALAGQSIGLRVAEPVKEGDIVYKV